MIARCLILSQSRLIAWYGMLRRSGKNRPAAPARGCDTFGARTVRVYLLSEAGVSSHRGSEKIYRRSRFRSVCARRARVNNWPAEAAGRRSRNSGWSGGSGAKITPLSIGRRIRFQYLGQRTDSRRADRDCRETRSHTLRKDRAGDLDANTALHSRIPFCAKRHRRVRWENARPDRILICLR